MAIKMLLQKPVDFLQRLFAPLRWSMNHKEDTAQGVLAELKTLVLEYYSTFAITIFQGVVYFTQHSTDDMMLIKPAYKEAQERYSAMMGELQQKARTLEDQGIHERIERIVREGTAAIVASSEARQNHNGDLPKPFYDFMIEIMSVQKQCLDLVSDIEEHIQQISSSAER